METERLMHRKRKEMGCGTLRGRHVGDMVGSVSSQIDALAADKKSSQPSFSSWRPSLGPTSVI